MSTISLIANPPIINPSKAFCAKIPWSLNVIGLVLILKKAKILRVSKRIEEEGLDVYEHGENAYN